MGAVHHVVDTFRFIIYCQVRSIVVSKAHARHEVGSINLVTVQNGRSHVGDRQGIELSLGRPLESPRRSLHQMVAVTCLIVNDADVTDRSLKKGILRGSICISSRNRTDIQCLSVRFADYLIQWSVILRIKYSCRTMRCHAFHTVRLINVTWAFGRFLCRCTSMYETRADGDVDQKIQMPDSFHDSAGYL